MQLITAAVGEPDRSLRMLRAGVSVAGGGVDLSQYAEARAGMAALELHGIEGATDLFPFERARVELSFGERLRRSGNRQEARRHLRAALETFAAVGAAAWAERAEAELAASGARMQKADESRGHLTPRELQIAAAVAAGRSNKEVAASLFVTPKTVEFHLTRIYRKLGVRSRTELVRRLAEQDADASATQATS